LAISMIAGNATPSDARMMWNPSVNAIWLRAAWSVVASISLLGAPGQARQQVTWNTASHGCSRRATGLRVVPIGWSSRWSNVSRRQHDLSAITLFGW